MSIAPLRVERTGGVAVLSLSRPEARNALSCELSGALGDALDRLARDESLRAVVLRGDGPSFCAGADLAERRSLTPDELTEHTLAVARAADGLAGLPVPVIAALRGHALAGGAELAIACDLRVAAADAQLGFPEVRVGIFPGAGGVERLPRLVGEGTARDLLFTGRRVGAAEALRLGLVDRVVAPDRVDAEALALASSIAEAAPLAVRALKAALADVATLPPAAARAAVAERRRALDATEDYAEGLRAFAERREPRFRGA